MKVLVCGGRDLTNSYWEKFENAMNGLGKYGKVSMVIEGGCRGADALAREWACSYGVHYATVPALWGNHGKSAGPKRNAAMLLLKPDVVVAFPGGAGTADMVRRAEKAGVSVIRVTDRDGDSL